MSGKRAGRGEPGGGRSFAAELSKDKICSKCGGEAPPLRSSGCAGRPPGGRRPAFGGRASP